MEHELAFRILFIIGDTLEHDKLVGLVKGPRNPLCRYCTISYSDTDNPKIKYTYRYGPKIEEMVLNGKGDLVRKMGLYPIPNNVVSKMCVQETKATINMDIRSMKQSKLSVHIA